MLMHYTLLELEKKKEPKVEKEEVKKEPRKRKKAVK
jgi:hypothetical protein